MKAKLEIKRIRRTRPDFTRQQSSYRKFRDAKWRYPRGKSSKIRMRISGHKRKPSIGYGSPESERSLNMYGLQEVLITNMNDLQHLNANKHAIVLAGSLGMKKRLELLTKIKEHDFHVVNVKDIDAYIKSVHDMMKKKKEDQLAKTKKKETKKKVEPKKEEVKQEQPELTQEDKDKEIKEEQRKILEKRA